MIALAIALLSQWMGEQVPDDVSAAVGACASVDLVASRAYSPSVWSDDVLDVAPLSFSIPASLSVTQGNAGNKRASLSFSLAGGSLVECSYEGGSPVAHPTTPADVALGLSYDFVSCDDGSVAGEQASADHFELHVHNGDHNSGSTEVSVTLGEMCLALAAAGPCDGGTWGGITWLGQTAHVRAGGDDLNDGSEGAPVASVERALEITRSWGSVGRKAIAVGPGTFDTSVALDQADDVDTWIMGCSAAETVLNGADPALPVVDLAMSAEGVKSLSIQGGSVGLRLRDGADAHVNDVAVVSTGQSGIRLEGAATLGWLKDVEVTDPVGGAGCAWGIAVDEATLISTGGAVRGAQEIGVGAIDADVVMLDFLVEGTAQNGAGLLGRGVHAQGGWTMLGNGRVIDNFDAGVFLLDPRGGVIQQISIEFTGAGITASGGATGDGVVVSGTSSTEVLVIRNIFFQNDRGGLVVDGADVRVEGNMSAGMGAFNAVKQGGGMVTGAQAPSVADFTATPVDLEKSPLSCY